MKAGRYFYHLKFELYNSPRPSAVNQEQRTKDKHSALVLQRKIYVPPPVTDIFTSPFPVHTSPWAEEKATRKHKATSVEAGPASRTQTGVKKVAKPGIIDCGPSRADASSNQAIAHTNTTSFGVHHRGSDPKTRAAEQAERDWRFAPIRMESIDMRPPRENHSSTTPSGSTSQAAQNGSVKAISGTRSSINAGPRSQATKAKFEPLTSHAQDGAGLKNTELGWGIVHLYRDGEERLELSTHPGEADGEGEVDTTILCIPAVPSYMTPNDFLGWVGEKTREEVSHFRMVMTGQMNRYLVLLKFRDAAVARRWREDWDGRIFGGLEVCHVFYSLSGQPLRLYCWPLEDGC
jgi:BRCA1-associated protein